MTDVLVLRSLVLEGRYRLTEHARDELADDGFELADLEYAFATSDLLEDYGDARRGPCCLLSGIARDGSPMHIVATTGGEIVVVITVYRPTLPKWITPTQRARRP